MQFCLLVGCPVYFLSSERTFQISFWLLLFLDRYCMTQNHEFWLRPYELGKPGGHRQVSQLLIWILRVLLILSDFHLVMSSRGKFEDVKTDNLEISKQLVDNPVATLV